MSKPVDYERALLGQSHQGRKVDRHIGALNRRAGDLKAKNDQQSVDRDDLEAQMAALRNEFGLPKPSADELERVLIDPDLLPSESEMQAIRRRLPDLSLGLDLPAADGDWDAYVSDVDAYVERQDLDVDRDPLAQLLPAGRAAEVIRRFDLDYGPTPWDNWDYGAIALTVLVGTLLDYFLVATPGANFKGQPQRGSPVTAWMKEQSKKVAPQSGADDMQRNALIRQELDKGWEKLLAGSGNLARLKEQRTEPAT